MKNFDKFLGLIKLLEITRGNIQLTESEAAFEFLRLMTDHRYDWTQEQKECYKMMTYLANEVMKNQ